MKISKKQLEQLIKESIKSSLKEEISDYWDAATAIEQQLTDYLSSKVTARRALQLLKSVGALNKRHLKALGAKLDLDMFEIINSLEMAADMEIETLHNVKGDTVHAIKKMKKMFSKGI